MSKKKIIFLLILTLLIGLVLFSYGCTPDTIIDENINLAIPEESELIEVTIGEEIIWSHYYFDVYDINGLYVESIILDPSLISNEDLAKLNSPGQKSIKISYKGKTLFLTVLVNPQQTVYSYDVIYDSTEGIFEETGTLPSATTRTEHLSIISELPIPVREGYLFIGWYLNPDFSGNRIVSPYNLTNDITLYAKWEHSERHEIEYREVIDGEDKGIIGSSITNITHGDNRSLMIPSARPKYDFIRYDLHLKSSGEFLRSITNVGEAIEVESNLTVKLIFQTRMLTINYFSDEWIEGIRTIQVEYGSNSDIHYFVLPEKSGYIGAWINRNTSLAPNYINIVEDMNIDAVYTIKTYTVRFIGEDSNEILDLRRTEVPHQTILSNYPSVPVKEGHSGEWAIISNLPETQGQFLEIDLADFLVESNINIYAIYTKNTYKITYRFSMVNQSTGTLDEIFTDKYHLFGSSIGLEDSENLYINRVFNEINYIAFDEIYYEVKWYTSESFESSKLVNFPFLMKSSNLVLFGRIIDRPFRIQFIIPAEYGLYEDSFFTVYKNNYFLPPEYHIPGFDILGWFANIQFSDFEQGKVYQVNEYVKYNDLYYKCLEDNVVGILPPENEMIWEYQGEDRPKEMKYLDQYPQFLADDFYLYNVDSKLDRAFYPLVTPKTYSIRFYTWEISGVPGNYTIDKSVIARDDVLSVQHGAIIRISNYFEFPPVDPYPPFPPTYPAGGPPSEFVLQNWYLDSDFSSEDISPEQDIVIDSDLTLYSYWTDLLAGTEGLIFSVFEGTELNPISYQITGFSPKNREYSSLDVVIPENYQGLPVKSLKSGVFSDNLLGLKIKTISIPANLQYIEENSFSGCKYLESFFIDAENESFILNQGVLFSYDLLNLICFPPLLSIEDEYIVNYSIPATTTIIYGGAFSNCVNLVEIGFSEVTTFGLNAYEGSNTTTFGEFAFSGCQNLNSIVIPNSVTTIHDKAFLACYALETIYIGEDTSLVFIGTDIVIDTKWFNFAQQQEFICLGNVLIAYNPQVLDSHVFIPDNIISIADNAFNFNNFDCSNLQTVTFSVDSDVLYIGKFVFGGCNQLTNLIILTQEKVTFELESLLLLPTECLLTVPASLINAYNSDTNINYIFSLELNNLVDY
jgi:uncharacterized repeat protein (TIGR02543 family)